jgi:hypothetical protein
LSGTVQGRRPPPGRFHLTRRHHPLLRQPRGVKEGEEEGWPGRRWGWEHGGGAEDGQAGGLEAGVKLAGGRLVGGDGGSGEALGIGSNAIEVSEDEGGVRWDCERRMDRGERFFLRPLYLSFFSLVLIFSKQTRARMLRETFFRARWERGAKMNERRTNRAGNHHLQTINIVKIKFTTVIIQVSIMYKIFKSKVNQQFRNPNYNST